MTAHRDLRSEFPHYDAPSSQISEAPACTRLWRAVLARALRDLQRIGENPTADVGDLGAEDVPFTIVWFAPDNPDFIAVCRMADYEPRYVLRKAAPILAKARRKLN